MAPREDRHPGAQGALSGFAWNVPAKGVRWVSAGPKNRRVRWLAVMGAGRDGQRPLDWRETLPLQQSADLYVQFAQLDESEDAIRRFASKNGLLTNGEWRSAGSTTSWLERGSLWRREIADMWFALELWERARQRIPLPIEKFIADSGAKATRWRLYRRRWKEAFGFAPDDATAVDRHAGRGTSPDELDLARSLVQELVDARLERHTCLGLRLAPERVFPSIGHDRNPRQGSLKIHPQPRNLLGALWLQFAQSVVGGWEHRPCQQCGRLVLIQLGARQSHTKYCSEACKQKAYRGRRAKATNVL